jgi:glyoxylase-like metal-dependent hydrolase (beta-lactamase superfamily II)
VVRLSDHVCRITFDYGLRPNLVISEGADGLLLVDTGHGETSGQLTAALQEFKGDKLKYIINTHAHGDHAGANAIGQDDTVLLGFQNLVLSTQKGILTAGEGPIQRQGQVVFPNYYRLDFNGEQIWIIPSPGVHSTHDIMIYFTDSKVVHMGDLLLSQSFPAVGPKVEPYLGVLDKVLKAFPEDVTFVSGHGKELTHSGVGAYKKMLLDTIEIIKAGKAAGKTADDLKNQDVLKDYKDWAFYLEFLDTDYWIEAVFQSLR